MNKHLNKLNLEVSELDTQVSFGPAHLSKTKDRVIFFQSPINHFSAFQRENTFSLKNATAVPVCRWGLSGTAHGTAGRILCASLQLFPHTREL